MNFYKHHIGDYATATSHLSLIEDGAYSRLIRRYYATEKPLPADIAACARLVGARTKPEVDAVNEMLYEFFVLEEDGWHQKRCDEEIALAQGKTERNREVGKRGGRPPKSETQPVSKPKPTNNPDGFQGEPTDNPIQNPVTSNQESRQTPDCATLRDAPGNFDFRSVPGLDADAWRDWLHYRAERKPAIKRASMEKAAKALAAMGPNQRAAVDHSIANGYQGLVEPKPQGKPPPRPPDSAQWAEAREAGRAMGFRDPYPAESVVAYLGAIEIAKRPPPRTINGVAELAARMRVAK